MQQLNEEQKKEVLRRVERSAAFQRVFKGKDGDLVSNELKKQLSGFDPDPYVHAFNAGKQFMWNFIQNALEGDVEKAREVLNAQTKTQGKAE